MKYITKSVLLFFAFFFMNDSHHLGPSCVFVTVPGKEEERKKMFDLMMHCVHFCLWLLVYKIGHKVKRIL